MTLKYKSLSLTAAMLLCLHLVQAVRAATPAAKTVAPLSGPLAGDAEHNFMHTGNGLPLAENGEAKMPIVIAEAASKEIKAAAAELADYLKQITGATFEVINGDGSSGIVLGKMEDFPPPAGVPATLDKALALHGAYDGREAYAIRTGGKRLLLVGRTDLGAQHAAYRFLELVGVRRFFQAPEWTVVPKIAALKFDINETDRPAIWSRAIWYGYGWFPDADKPSFLQSRAYLDYQAWRRHNRMAQSLGIYAGHAWQSIINDNKAEFEAHPEYLALVTQPDKTQKRQGEQLCVSNPGTRKLAVQWALNYLKNTPTADMVSMECSDGGGQCECAECAKLGSMSDRIFGLANEVARAVAKEYPGKMVGLYAYNEHTLPPSFDLEPNVYVQLTHGFNRGNLTFDQLEDVWSKKCRNLGFYEYFSVWAWDQDQLPGGSGGNLSFIKDFIPRHAAHNATSIDAESGDNWGPHGRGYYIANKLMWNPKVDTDELLKDFYEQAFGAGAAAMKRYYERFDPGSQPMMSEDLLARGFHDVDEAAQATKDDPGIQARLDQIKQYLRYVQLRWQFDHETDKAKRKVLGLALITHTYRTRYNYMNHWEAQRQSWSWHLSDEFKEPTWYWAEATPNKPWAIETPYTHEETEKEFQEGLQLFKIENVQQKQFSKELVAVKFDKSPEYDSYQQYQNSAPYVFYSVQGEPLTMEIMAGLIAGYRDKPPATYSFTDARGKQIAQAQLPLDGKFNKLEIKVPAAGAYYLNFNDSGAGWAIKVSKNRPASIITGQGPVLMHLGWMVPAVYFYVPKGTEKIEYFWNGGPHQICGPDGKVFKEVSTSGKSVSIPVPPGTDGQPWSFRQIALGQLKFHNIPNYVAGSPNALLVPNDVAAEDGLQVLGK